MKQSKEPDNPANCEGEDWAPSTRVCEKCGALVWTASWWDDPSSSGGSVIGTMVLCGDCGDNYYE